MADIGRNDPCHCGSGKKYKHCHLPSDRKQQQDKRAWQRAAAYLRRDLPAFAREERFALDFARALPFYWNSFYTVETATEMSQPEAIRFFDWFVHDYHLENGERLVDIYREENWELLSSHQQQVLAAWQEADAAWGYTLVDYDGPQIHLADFVTGETFDAFEGGGRGLVQKGEIILTRLVPVNDRLEFATSAAYLPAAEITDIVEQMAAARETFMADNPEADEKDFRRANTHLLIHHALAQAEVQGRPPVARLNPNRTDTKTQNLLQRMMRKRR